MKRVVSLLACTTEMIFALGREDCLVGRSHECDFPPEAFSLPVVTRANIRSGTSEEIHLDLRERQSQGLSLYDVDEELLAELKPDLLLTQNQCEVCAVTPEDVLRSARDLIGDDTEVLAIKPFSLDDVWDEFRRIARAVDAGNEAEEVLRQWKTRLRNLPQPEVRPSVLILEWLDPLMGCGYWTPELVEMAGGKEVLGQKGEHAQWLTMDELLEIQPDVLVLAPCGLKLPEILEEAKRLGIMSDWNGLKAVRAKRVFAIDGNAFLSRSGPRLVESAEILSRIFGGECEGEGWAQL